MSDTDHGRICVPICESRALDLRQAMSQAAEVADIIELRLDYLQGDELFRALRNLPSLINASARPVIVTLRSIEQGGNREMDTWTPIIFWSSISFTANLTSALRIWNLTSPFFFNRESAPKAVSF